MTDKPATHSRGVVAVLAAGGIVAALTQTLVVPLIGELPKILGTTASNATWVVTATMLAAAVIMPVAGRLGDMYGKRRMLLISTVPLIAGSAISAISSTLVPMIIGRGLQGLGMGIVPLGISLLREVVPAERLGSSIALMSASMGVGGALGLPLSAAIAQNSSWRVLFWTSAALGAAIAALIIVVVPSPETEPTGGRFDLPGAIGLSIGLVSFLLAVSKGSDWGWGSATTLGFFAVAIVVLAIWAWWELRTRQPLVDLRVTARGQVLLTNVASVLVGFAMYAQSLIVPQLLQLPTATGYGLGQSMLAMGLWMAPAGLMMIILSPLGAKLSAARGPKITLGVGSLVVAIGYGSSTMLMGSTWGLLVVTLICNTGVGLAYGAMPALIMGAVPHTETAAANSFNSLMRSIGTSTSAAVIGVVLANLTTNFHGIALPSESGFRTGMLIGSGVAVVAALIAFAIPTKKKTVDGPAPAGEAELAGAPA